MHTTLLTTAKKGVTAEQALSSSTINAFAKEHFTSVMLAILVNKMEKRPEINWKDLDMATENITARAIVLKCLLESEWLFNPKRDPQLWEKMRSEKILRILFAEALKMIKLMVHRFELLVNPLILMSFPPFSKLHEAFYRHSFLKTIQITQPSLSPWVKEAKHEEHSLNNQCNFFLRTAIYEIPNKKPYELINFVSQS